VQYIDFDDIWNRININKGNIFRTKTGKEFSYSVIGEGIITTRTDYKLTKGDFEKPLK
jgi:hypothetical protein